MLCGGKERQPSSFLSNASLDSNGHALHVVGTASETIQDVDGTSYTVYRVRVAVLVRQENEQGQPSVWEVCRRYSEFHDLHTLMRALGVVLAELPSKSPFAMMSSVKRSREIGLRDYLNQVLAHCNDDQCQLLSKFLRVNRHLKRGLLPNAPCTRQHHASWREVADAAPGTHASASVLSPLKGGGRSDGSDNAERLQSGASVGTSGLGREVVAGVPHSSLRTQGAGADLEQRGKGQVALGEGHDPSLCESTESCLVLPPVWSVDAVSGAGIDPVVHARGKLQHPPGDRRSPGGTPMRGTGGVPASGRKQLLDHSNKAGVGLFFVQGIEGGECMVDEVIAGSAAARDGRIVVGDVLASVDGQGVSGMSLTCVRSLIIGDAGTLVSLDVVRGGSKVPTVRLQRSAAQPQQQVGAVDSGDLGEIDDSQQQQQQQAEEPHSRPDESSAPSALRLDTLGGGGVLKVRALCAFPAQKEHELELGRGDVVTVTRQHGSGWWEGVALEGGRRGWFPSNHVELMVEGRLAGGGAMTTPSSESMTSGQSLSNRSTVPNEMSGNSTGLSHDASPRTPGHLAEMSVHEVCEWLRALELGEYVDVFRANKIDGELLSEMQESELIDDFGMTNKYHRKRLLNRLSAQGTA